MFFISKERVLLFVVIIINDNNGLQYFYFVNLSIEPDLIKMESIMSCYLMHDLLLCVCLQMPSSYYFLEIESIYQLDRRNAPLI